MLHISTKSLTVVTLMLVGLDQSGAMVFQQAMFKRVNNFDVDVSNQTLGECAVECLASPSCNGFLTGEACQYISGAVECMHSSVPCFLHESLVSEEDQRESVSTLHVTNGLPEGDWAAVELCPDDSYAAGFQMSAIEWLGYGWSEGYDDEAVTALMLSCVHLTILQPLANITSHHGSNGDWQTFADCPSDYWITGFSLKVQEWHDGDNVGVVKMRVRCRGPGLSGTSEIVVDGVIGPDLRPNYDGWGSFGDWSASCSPGDAVCGLASRALTDQGPDRHDAGLTDVILVCC